MAQAPKIPAIANPNQLGPARAAAPTVSVGEYNPYVDSPVANASVLLGGAEFSYEQPRQQTGFAYDPRREQRSVPQSWSLVQTPSETFARILENIAGGVEGTGETIRGSAKRFQNVISRAIAIYETNAKIIHGETALVGGAVSLRL
jgi:hypothetical protein